MILIAYKKYSINFIDISIQRYAAISRLIFEKSKIFEAFVVQRS